VSGDAITKRGVLVDDLAQEIQLRIMTGELVSGTWLRQETLAEDFGVSRTPIREALRKLQADGLVDVVPHRGALVRGPTARAIHEAYQVRADLEGLAAELASTRILDSQLAQLQRAEQLFRRAVKRFLGRRRPAAGRASSPITNDADWVRANDLFHEVIQEAAGNDRLRETIRQLHRAFPRNLTWSALAEDSRLLEENVQEHAAILQAIEQRNAEAARAAMTAHVLRAGDLVATWFERRARA